MGTKMYVDSDDLTSVANAIRTKGGTAASLVFPAGFSQAIADLPSGGGGDPSDDLKTVLEDKTVGQYGAGYVLPSNPADKVRANAFRESHIKEATFPNATSIGDYAFYGSSLFDTIIAPSATDLGAYAFASCRFLGTLGAVDFPSAQTIGAHAFEDCYWMTALRLGQCRSIAALALSGCTSLATLIIDDVQSVPTLASNGIPSNVQSAIQSIYVPDSLVSSFQSATNWSAMSAKIKAVSQMPSA